MKRKYTRNFERLRITKGCLTDCVAYFLDLHPRNVPYFVYPRKGWNERLKAFFKKHGYEVYWTNKNPIISRGLYLVCGDSLAYKTFAHVVVYRGKKMVYDPQYPSQWSDERATHRLVIKKSNYRTKKRIKFYRAR